MERERNININMSRHFYTLTRLSLQSRPFFFENWGTAVCCGNSFTTIPLNLAYKLGTKCLMCPLICFYFYLIFSLSKHHKFLHVNFILLIFNKCNQVKLLIIWSFECYLFLQHVNIIKTNFNLLLIISYEYVEFNPSLLFQSNWMCEFHFH